MLVAARRTITRTFSIVQLMVGRKVTLVVADF